MSGECTRKQTCADHDNEANRVPEAQFIKDGKERIRWKVNMDRKQYCAYGVIRHVPSILIFIKRGEASMS